MQINFYISFIAVIFDNQFLILLKSNIKNGIIKHISKGGPDNGLGCFSHNWLNDIDRSLS